MQVAGGRPAHLEDGFAERDDDDRAVAFDEVAGAHVQAAHAEQGRAAEVHEHRTEPQHLSQGRFLGRAEHDESRADEQGRQESQEGASPPRVPARRVDQQHDVQQAHREERKREHHCLVAERLDQGT